MSFLLQLIIILLATRVASWLAQRISLPSVIGELLVGIILGPLILDLLKPNLFIHYFAEVGVILLMFLTGLESELTQLLKLWKPAISVAVLGVILPVVSSIWSCSVIFHLHWAAALFVGLVLSATSVSISVQVLREFNWLNTKAGIVILGAAVADDIICVTLLGVCVSLMNNGSGTIALLKLLSLPLLFIGLIAVINKILPQLIHYGQKLWAAELFLPLALIMCFGLAYSAELLGLSSVLGAYIAGLLLSRQPHFKAVNTQIESLGYGIFIPVFFVSIGLNVSAIPVSALNFVLFMTSLAIVGKLLGGVIGAHIFNLAWRPSLVVGAGMVSRGEMALVVANIALSSHLLNHTHYSLLIVITVLTTLAAPILMRFFITNHYLQKI